MSAERYSIRLAQRDDCKEICRLIKALAVEMKNDAEHLKPEVLERDGYDFTPPKFRCFVAEDKSLPDGVAKGTLCGYVLFYPTYHGWNGPSMCLENIYVAPECQGTGLGTRLIARVAQMAYAEDCFKLEFLVFAWNSATEFYSKVGGLDVTLSKDLHIWRLDRNAMAKLSESLND